MAATSITVRIGDLDQGLDQLLPPTDSDQGLCRAAPIRTPIPALQLPIRFPIAVGARARRADAGLSACYLLSLIQAADRSA